MIVIGRTGVLAMCLAAPCVAQTAGAIAISAGSATDVTGAGSSAVTVAPSFTRSGGRSTTSLAGSATRFGNQAWSLGAGFSLNGRAQPRAITPVIDVAGTAATTSYDLTYATADVIPSLEGRVGRLKLFGGARLGASGISALAAPTGTGPFGGLPSNERRISSAATARTVITGLSVSGATGNGEVAFIGYRVESGSVADERQTDHSINTSIANSRLQLAGSVARRSRASIPTTSAVATLGISVTPLTMIQFSAGNYPSNPMLGTAAGKFVNAGVSVRFGRRVGQLPAPTGAPAPVAGRTRLSIRADGARVVELAGDFNKWQPLTTTRAANGVWYVDLDLTPGEYRYAFRIDGREWRVPEGVAAVDDEFGGKSAWLTVTGPASR